MKYTMKLLCFAGMVMLCFGSPLHAQDSLRITLPEAEKLFLSSNLQLLAEKYNVSISKALEVQARLYNNPTLTMAGSLYDPVRNKVFNVSNKNGQYDIAIQQVIRLAGKRNKEILLAEAGTAQTESSFYNLMRTLRYSLRSSFYKAYFLQLSIKTYREQLVNLRKLSEAYDQMLEKGVVTLKESVRIRSVLYSTEADITSLQNQLSEVTASLQLLLHDDQHVIVPVMEASGVNGFSIVSTLKELQDSALANRADIKLAEDNLFYNQQNLKLQKALATPDLTLGGEFDRRGSFVDNASFLTVAVDLPLFKRNQGNIRAAKIGIDQSKLLIDQQMSQVQVEVASAYTRYQSTDRLMKSMDPDFGKQYQQLLDGIFENFRKKNISLLEFTDFYQAYRENALQTIQLGSDKLQAAEDLQYAVGKPIF